MSLVRHEESYEESFNFFKMNFILTFNNNDDE